jgi:diguanylate cyclase (GGDEF)-like protein
MHEEDETIDLERIMTKLSEEERAYVTGLIDKDPLTGVYNRRKFDRDLALVVAMSDRTKRGSCLLIVDIDHFKKYNDEYGHQEGDRVLKMVTQGLQFSLRDYDGIHLYRYGGEEFVVIIPEIGIKDAMNIGNRLKDNIKKNCGVSVSVGISHYKENSDDLQSLVENADKALYEAKRRGRDRVEVYYKDA